MYNILELNNDDFSMLAKQVGSSRQRDNPETRWPLNVNISHHDNKMPTFTSKANKNLYIDVIRRDQVLVVPRQKV